MTRWNNSRRTKDVLLLIVEEDMCPHSFKYRCLAIRSYEMRFISRSASGAKSMNDTFVCWSISRGDNPDTYFANTGFEQVNFA